MVNVRLEASGFADLSRALRRASGIGVPDADSLRKAMTKEAREVAKPILEQMRSDVMALDSSAKGSGGLARAKRTAKAVGKAESAFGHSDRQIERADKRAGSLRAAVARSLRIVVKDSGFKVGVRIRTEGSRLPSDQRYLPRGLDSTKGWRHPVFKTGEWVTQYGTPPGWFMANARANRPMAERRMRKIVERYVDQLAARINRTA